MAFDALLSRTARSFVDGLARPDRQELDAALDALLRDPFPDGVSKVDLPFPYRPGTYGYAAGSFWFAYSFLHSLVLYVAAVYWSRDSPNHPLYRQ